MHSHKSSRPCADALPPECWVHVASFLLLQERISLSLVCKQLFDVTRVHGAALWENISISFNSAATLHSFAQWRQRCACNPHLLLLQHGEVQEGDPAPPKWSDVVQVAQTVLPSLTHLMIRWEGEAVAGEWLRSGTQLNDLGLYCSSLTVQDDLACLTGLKELNMESTEVPLAFESAATLPPGITKLFAVDSHLHEIPEALTRVTALQCAYLSRNPLSPPSLSRLAALPRLELLSLIGCSFELPPAQLSTLTPLRALYFDYNSALGNEHEADMQAAFSQALTPLTALEALGLSHNFLDSWPEAIERLPRLKVLYLEQNPGIAQLPPSAQPLLSNLHTLSCDCSVLFSNTTLLGRGACHLEHLFVSGSGLMWHALPVAAPTEAVLEALAAMPALKRVTFVVQTQKEEMPSVEVASLMMRLARHCPHLTVEALDSEQFYGVTLTDLDRMREEDAAAAALKPEDIEGMQA